jgi:hypothetical protein
MTYNQLWTKATVETHETFVAEYFLSTVDTILVQHLTDHCTSLILHPSSCSATKLAKTQSKTHRVCQPMEFVVD